MPHAIEPTHRLKAPRWRWRRILVRAALLLIAVPVRLPASEPLHSVEALEALEAGLRRPTASHTPQTIVERFSRTPRPTGMKKLLLTLAAAFTLAGAAFADHEPGHKILVLKNKDGAAILGYDTVAYFTDNKAVKGTPKIQSEYEGAKYYFASTEHKAMFDANSAKYAPA